MNLDLFGADLSKASLRESNLWGAVLKKVNLIKADLKEADLNRADLSDANMSAANLRAANLYKANLKQANLHGADLSKASLAGAFLWRANIEGIRNWREISSIENANIYQIQNAPKGFRKWALANGACEMGDARAWRIFGCSTQEKHPESIIPAKTGIGPSIPAPAPPPIKN